MRSSSDEREAVADFIGCAGGREVAFVEKKPGGHEASESGLAEDSPFRGAEWLSATMACGAGQRDVGMEWTDLGHETADGGGYRDALGEGD
jgi:hypothetical protein